MIFRDRTDAGRRLAEACGTLAARFPSDDLLVLGIPRGGVPVAAEVARVLGAPLDVIVVRKLGVPRNAEVAMGAIGDGVRILDERLIHELGITADEVDVVERRERVELASRLERFRAGRPALDATGTTAVVVDDGIATGATARAACAVVRSLGAKCVIVAVPVAPPDWRPSPGVDADELIAVATPTGFFAIGQWYTDFAQTTDDEVRAALKAN